MGTVYRARDLETQAAVAVKILHQNHALDAERATREAQMLARLDAPGVVRYLGDGTVGQTRYLVTEWIAGGTLGDRLLGEGMTLEEALLVTRRVAEVLAPVHAAGVVHRDIKPSNILLRGGQLEDVRLIDFGLAWRAELTRLTRTGTLVGTPGYMAPEQVRGERNLDARVDVWALGCVLYECLTGRPAFLGGDVTAVHAKILLATPPRDALPEPVGALVERLLAKDPHARPADAGEVAAALAAVRVEPGGARRRRPESAWADEQRRVAQVESTTPTGELFWLVLAMTDPTEEIDETAVRAVAGEHGAVVDRLPDGAVLAAPARVGSPQERAASAARLALALRDVLPEAPLVIAGGCGQRGTPGVVDAVLERGLRLLEASALAALADETCGIHVDDRTLAYLGPEFPVEGGRLIPRAARAV